MRCDAYLRVSEVDLHDEGQSHARGEGEAGRDDDGQSVSLAGAFLLEGISGGLAKGRGVVAGQVRGRRGQALEASRVQEQVGVWKAAQSKKA